MNNKFPRRRILSIPRRFIRRRAYWLLILAILASVSFWRTQTAGRPVILRPAIPLSELPPVANKLVNVHFPATSLSNIFADLSHQLGIPFVIDWQTLKDSGRTPETVITLEPETDQPIPLAEVLAMLGRPKIMADVACNPVVISTEEGIYDPKRYVKVAYPIADFNHIDSPWMYLDDVQSHRERLASLIRDTINPEKWRESGGLAFVRCTDNLLIVDAPPILQYQVKEFLAVLRSK